ncbi:cytochrome P450 [Aspergillus vadensis CBS 113365]|uniref:Cytochrome P450 n=1 Tax=Aspergillus vadensis (strain CBS 113365 / IMI 142717 / IBT 24658) TaxID=1448311 RepID=A0A319BA02_ASPVC|nr:cytochrome P450 [Aspergillus vadensis CBS 113365]PYH69405.1 cytochrome P450 [Aspergillus vadensis CBS 113365]
MTSTPYLLQPVSNICLAMLDKQFSHYVFISALVLCILIGYKLFIKRDDARLPTGPRPLPIVGNIHQMLTQRPIEVVHKWHQNYGTMVAFRYGQQLAISIGSFDIAQELLAKRGAIYSSRPQFAIAARMTRGVNSAIMPYGKEWQNQHRIMSSLLDSTTVNRYCLLENMESKQALSELLDSHEFEAIIRRYAGSIVMTLGYGIRLETTDNDIPVQLLALKNHPFDAIGNSYYRVVELFPVLDKLPECLAPWKRFSDNVEQETTKFHMKHFEIGKSASTWNWVQNALKTKAGSQIASTELAYVIGTLQQAGFEAILTVLRLIIKAIVLHPQCLKEAQRELDRVVGPDRLPSSEDIPQLRYINAILNEAMRWQPPTPFAIPHATTQDDEYMGYQIPSGTVIIPNIWVMSFDPKVFPDPHNFKPERWIDNPDLEHSPFGFGRRICPGRHLGWNSVFILMARLMWAYNITHSYKGGKRIEIDPWDIKLTFTAASRPFKASFEVREPKKQEIIEREWENATKDPVQILEEIGRKTG